MRNDIQEYKQSRICMRNGYDKDNIKSTKTTITIIEYDRLCIY